MRITFTSGRVRRLAERSLVGDLGRRGERKLARALLGSASDREAYHLLAELFRTLEGEPLLTHARKQRILTAASPGVLTDEGGLLPWAGRWLVPAGAMALVLLAAVLVFPPAPQLEPRGSSALRPANQGRLGLEAICIHAGRPVAPPPRSTGLDARCRLGDELQLVLTHTAGYRHLLVVGLQEGGEERWYFPAPPHGRSALAPREVEHEPLGQAIRLAVNHRPGPLRLVGFFSRSETRADQLLAWLLAQDTGTLAGGLLPGLNAEVTAVELRVMIEGDAP